MVKMVITAAGQSRERPNLVLATDGDRERVVWRGMEWRCGFLPVAGDGVTTSLVFLRGWF